MALLKTELSKDFMQYSAITLPSGFDKHRNEVVEEARLRLMHSFSNTTSQIALSIYSGAFETPSGYLSANSAGLLFLRREMKNICLPKRQSGNLTKETDCTVSTAVSPLLDQPRARYNATSLSREVALPVRGLNFQCMSLPLVDCLEHGTPTLAFLLSSNELIRAPVMLGWQRSRLHGECSESGAAV
jgi:hypothetical protein